LKRGELKVESNLHYLVVGKALAARRKQMSSRRAPLLLARGRRRVDAQKSHDRLDDFVLADDLVAAGTLQGEQKLLLTAEAHDRLAVAQVPKEFGQAQRGGLMARHACVQQDEIEGAPE